MSQKQVVILVVSISVALWLILVYLIFTTPRESLEEHHVSSTAHYAKPFLSLPLRHYPPVSVRDAQGTTMRGYTYVAPAQTELHPQQANPLTYLHSGAAVQNVGSGIVAGWTSGEKTTRTASQRRGVNTTNASQVWIGMVSPVASHDLAYVPAQSGDLPDKSYLSGRRLAPPDEGGGGSNGPNIEVETPLGDGLAVLALCVLLYIAAVDYRKFNNKQPKE